MLHHGVKQHYFAGLFLLVFGGLGQLAELPLDLGPQLGLLAVEGGVGNGLPKCLIELLLVLGDDVRVGAVLEVVEDRLPHRPRVVHHEQQYGWCDFGLD